MFFARVPVIELYIIHLNYKAAAFSGHETVVVVVVVVIVVVVVVVVIVFTL